tara:strand:+ start:36 stop:1169 length:1134 start_codon:yes stop_codon:yes gene_type:complete
MAGNKKPFDQINDVSTIKTLLREAIPVTGSLVSGTYAEPNGAGVTSNIKEYAHQMFQSTFDYPYASSSANHLFDITAGYSTNSALDGATDEVSGSKKNNIYNEMAQFLVGFDQTGSIERFDKDGDLTGGEKIDEIFVLNLSRLLVKDGIQKGTFDLEMGVSGNIGFGVPMTTRIKIQDLDSSGSFKVNSPKGEYGILYANNSEGSPIDSPTHGAASNLKTLPVGLIYYQAGVAIISASTFMATSAGIMSRSVFWTSGAADGGRDVTAALTASSLDAMATGFRYRMHNLSFNNTTILNSAMYTCRIASRDFNYSSNPTYLTGSEIRVKANDPTNNPKSFITTVGLYNAQDQLLAVSKLSKPIEKSPAEDLLIKVRLDY